MENEAQPVKQGLTVPRKLMIAGGVVLVLLIVLASAAFYQRGVEVKANQDADSKAATSAQITTLQKQVATEKARADNEYTKRMAVCSYVTSKTKEKATMQYVVVPVVACS